MTEIFQWRFIATACFCLFNTLNNLISIYMGLCWWTHIVIQVIEVYLSAYFCGSCVSLLSVWMVSQWHTKTHSLLSQRLLYTLLLSLRQNALTRPEVNLPLPASCTLLRRLCQDIKSFCEKNNWGKVKNITPSYLQPRHTPRSLSVTFHLALKAMFVPREEYHLFFLDPIFIKQTPRPCILQRRRPAGCRDMRKIVGKYSSLAVLFFPLLWWFSISKLAKAWAHRILTYSPLSVWDLVYGIDVFGSFFPPCSRCIFSSLYRYNCFVTFEKELFLIPLVHLLEQVLSRRSDNSAKE